MLELACIRRYRELMRYAEWERSQGDRGIKASCVA